MGVRKMYNKYRIKLIETVGGKRYIPQRHVWFWFWENLNRTKVRETIFFPNINVDSVFDHCYSESQAKQVIKADQSYYKSTHANDVIKETYIPYEDPKDPSIPEQDH